MLMDILNDFSYIKDSIPDYWCVGVDVCMCMCVDVLPFLSAIVVSAVSTVVDSFTAKFRSFYTGREQLPDRAKGTARHFGFLDRIASKFNCAVVLTCQATDVPDAQLQLKQLDRIASKFKQCIN